MQWIFVLCGCMFLLSLIATYQVCTVSLKAGLYTYNAVEPTANSLRSYVASAIGGGSPLALGATGAGGKTAETTSQDRRGSAPGEGVSSRPAAAPFQGRLSAKTCRHPAVVHAVPAGCVLFRATCGILCVPQGLTVC
jgi:hypothetical protein